MKLSQEVSRRESRILGALSKLHEFLLNPQVRTCPVAVRGTSRNNDSGNRDNSMNDPYPKVDFSACRTNNLTDSDPEKTYHMVTGTQEEFTYCSAGTP